MAVNLWRGEEKMFEGITEAIKGFLGKLNEEKPPSFFIVVSDGLRGIETFYHEDIVKALPNPYKKQVITFLEGIIKELQKPKAEKKPKAEAKPKGKKEKSKK